MTVRNVWKIVAAVAPFILSGGITPNSSAAAEQVVNGEISIEIAQEYDNNIFAEDLDISSKETDFVTTVLPRFVLEGGGEQGHLSLQGGAAIRQYWQNGAESTENFDVSLDGGTDGGALISRLGFRRSHEDRRSAEDVFGDKPTRFDEFSAEVAVNRTFGDIDLGLSSSWRKLNFADARRGALVLNNDDRDRNRWEIGAAVGMSAAGQSKIYGRAKYIGVNYSDELDDFGIDRDSQGYDVRVGTFLKFSEKLSIDMHVGYRDQSYKDVLLADVDSIVYGLELAADITPYLDIRASVSRDSHETSFAETDGIGSGYFSTKANAEVQWDLVPGRLSLALEGGLTRNDWTGNDRNDDISLAQGSLRMRVWRRLSVKAGYRFEHRASNSPNDDYTKNIAFLEFSAVK